MVESTCNFRVRNNLLGDGGPSAGVLLDDGFDVRKPEVLCPGRRKEGKKGNRTQGDTSRRNHLVP